MKREDCICFSGGANGAEATFGDLAERFGIDEVNFTFEGHNPARTRGQRILTRAELRRGDLALAHVATRMHRKYPDTPLFRKMLQTLWHQVHNGHEIFVVGTINDDETVTGGTGIAAEYAKLFAKPVYVFDQVRDDWFQWTGDAWSKTAPPHIRQPLFCGTGTRFLEGNGRAAIEGLYSRSFG